MTAEWKIKPFNALSSGELYAMLELRSEVFVVEQNCVYQDIDGKDGKALHVLAEADGVLVAYARLFGAGDYFKNPSIGRVVVKPRFRKLKLGHELMRRSISALEEAFGKSEIEISAQLYLKAFYESHGFAAIGEPYPEDGIPHILMLR
jgi:ElaA protein